MRKDLQSFSESLPEEFPIAAFPHGSFCLYHSGFIHVLKKFTLLNGQVEFSQHVKITPVPRISPTVKINRITVSEDGSRAVLLTEDTVYVVLLELEVLKILSKKSSAIEVFCECQKLGNQFLHPAVKVLDAKFIPEYTLSGCQLSVLTSDNFIRIYNLISDFSSPVVEIDFNTVLFLNEADSSHVHENTFGLYTSVVCYDLITCSAELSFLAFDSDGHLYAATVIEGCEPLVQPLNGPTLPCDPTNLFNIYHPFSKVFSAYATFSAVGEGSLSHFILIPKERTFEVYLHEKINLAASLSRTHFTALPSGSAYFIGTPIRLYLVDCRNWINYYINIISSNSSLDHGTDSKIHIVAVCGSIQLKANAETLGQVVSLKCSTEDGELTLLLIRFPSSPLFQSLMKNQLSENLHLKIDNSAEQKELDWKVGTIDPIMNQMKVLPKLMGISKENGKKILNEFELWLSSLSHNLDILKSGSIMTIKRLTEIGVEANTLLTKRTELDGRLAVVGADMIRFHEEASRRRHCLDALANRIESLSRRASDMRPLTAQEKQMLKTLKDYKKQAISLSERAANMSVTIAEEKRSTFGSAKAFQPSHVAYLANIERTSREMETVISRLNRISQQLESE